MATTQLGIGLADLYERNKMPQDRPRPPASWASLLFLGFVLLAYFLLQGAVARLAPGPESVVTSVCAYFSGPLQASSSWLPDLRLPSSALPPSLALFLAVFTGLYVGGLVDYLVHRFVSHSRVLFFTHEYHHLPSEVFLLMPGLAARPFAIVASFPVTLITAASAYGVLHVLGQPVTTPEPMLWLLFLHVSLLVTSHSSFLRRFPAVHKVMRAFGLTTPQEHLLHHTTDLRGNYANLTTIWDRVFGTYLDPDVVTMEGRRLGLDYDQDWLGAVTLGFFKIPKHLRDRFDVGRWCNLQP